MIRFAGGDDPIELLRSTRGGVQRLLCGPCAEGEFILSFGSIGERFDSGTAAKFAGRHAESAVNFLGRNDSRTYSRGRGRDDRSCSRYGIAHASVLSL